MIDLETRLRTEFHSDVADCSADQMIGAVRRGSRQRRTRNRAVLGATAAVVIAAAGARLVAHPPSDAPATVHTPFHITNSAPGTALVGQPVGITVSQDGVFALTEFTGCAYCSTVWSRTADGGWTRLHDFRSATPARDRLPGGPVGAFRMAPDGQNGWAWGEHFWVTHDAGRTWQVLTPADGAPAGMASGLSVLAGTHTAWTTSFDHGQMSVWRTDVASDHWTQVALPASIAQLESEHPRQVGIELVAVLPDDRAVIAVSLSGTTSDVLISSADGWNPTSLPPTAVPSSLFGGDMPVDRVSLQDLVGTTYSGATVEGPRSFTFELAALGIQATDDGSSVTASRWLFLHDAQAAVVDSHGATTVDLPLATDDVLELSTSGDQAWLVTKEGALWASADGGTTWSQENAGTGSSH